MIKSGKVVNLSYSLSDAEGQILDRANLDDPFVYLHGASQIVPGLEQALEGMAPGEKKKISVEPSGGYGDRDPELKIIVQRTQFPAGAKIEAGMEFQTSSPDGHSIVFFVEKVEGEKVHLDGNHPLAGKTLHFDIEVLSVRDASKDELEHGHAHGPHGHGHGYDDDADVADVADDDEQE